MEKRDILERLISHYANGNKAKFSNLLGVSPQSISTWLARNTFDVDKIYANCVGISGDWLLTGEGSMLKDTPPPIAHQVNGQENLDLSQQSLALPKSLPYIKYEHLADLHFPLDPECKYDGASTTRKFIECRAQFVTEYRQQDALPIIPPGSSVACKTISKDDVIDKALCLLILNGNVLIRKVSFGFDKEHYNTTNINGENPLELAKSEVLSIHRIMAYLVTYP